MSDDHNETIQLVPVDSINILNPRERNKNKFREVKSSISSVGLKKPITINKRRRQVNGKAYDLVCGQGRLEAFIELGQQQIPAIIVELSKEESFLLSLVENLARRQHTSLELMQNIGVLSEKGYSPTDISAKTGLSREYVVGLLQLFKNGEERLLAAVERGQIPVSVALNIASSAESDAQQALSEAYESRELRGQKLQIALKVIKSRKRLGKKLSVSPRGYSKNYTAQSMVRAYKQETERQRALIQKANLTEGRLTVIKNALNHLFADENFITLLRAEGLETIPKQLALKTGRLESSP